MLPIKNKFKNPHLKTWRHKQKYMKTCQVGVAMLITEEISTQKTFHSGNTGNYPEDTITMCIYAIRQLQNKPNKNWQKKQITSPKER